MQLGVIDIGGTSIKYGIASDAGELFSLDSIPAEAYKGGPLIVEKVKMICDMLLKQARVEGHQLCRAD